MNKIFISIMLAGALLAGGSVYAQAPDKTTATENVKPEKSKKAKSDRKAKGMKKRQNFNPFDGVQLTDDQMQKLQVLQQGLGPVELTPEQQAKIKENPNLTPEEKQQLKQERKAKKAEAKKNYLNGVKEILSPEQYVLFLENLYLYSPQDQGYASKIKDKKSEARKGKKAPRHDKKEKKEPTQPK